MKKAMKKTWWAAALLAIAPMAAASGPTGLSLDIDPNLLTEGFLSAHPDIRWQREGMHSYERGDYEIALAQFKRGARHASKFSQAMIANMYWEGVGVPRDRPLAYAWMDIAAERLYPDLIQFRELYWTQLEPGERRQAIQRGQAILAEYGDDAAKPRLESALLRERRRMTGSRTGITGNMRVIPLTGPLATAGGVEFELLNAMAYRGEEFYADRYWRPEQYWRMQDEAWNAPDREGRVQVGSPATLHEGDDD